MRTIGYQYRLGVRSDWGARGRWERGSRTIMDSGSPSCGFGERDMETRTPLGGWTMETRLYDT